MGAISHASILMPTTGIVVPLLIWATQKDKSPYLRFQALQAMVYHLALLLGLMVGMVLYVLSFFGTGILGFGLGSMGVDPDVAGIGMFALPFGTIMVLMLGQLGMIAYGLLGSALTLTGRSFRYPFIASWLERTADGALAAS